MERSGLVLSESGLRLLLRALRAEARRLELEIAVTRERIRMFEEKYGMSSEEFMSRYTGGSWVMTRSSWSGMGSWSSLRRRLGS